MLVVTNRAGYFRDRKLEKMMKGKSEYAWRTDEAIVKLISKRLGELKYLGELISNNTATSNQLARYTALISYNHNWKYFRIVEVDTARKWTIAEYDTSYGVVYLEETPHNNYLEMVFH